ncbi:MAG: FAD-dependent oxidoreductase [Bacteroidales bacterium]|nr:FAD-dependent oxidoreductase [Bacteroidales bacterium]
MSKKINIILNGDHITCDKGDYVLNVAKKHGVDIPTLCNDPRLEPFSSCFVCVVEVENMRGLQPSCSTRVMDGMVIHTKNEKVRKSRKSALDLIMSNHYADCVAPCTETCPAGVDVQGYISLIDKGLYHEAVALIKQDNPLPAICGRVCVRPCEAACNRNEMNEGAPVGIDYMKRFVSDYDLMSGNHYIPKCDPSTGKKVAIIGGGPGGLSAASFLSQKGHKCDIFESAPEPGGWLRYGIPEYRLPNDLLQREISTVRDLGAEIFCNSKLGENILFKDLQENYDSIILAIGSQKGTLVGVKGDEAQGVFSGINFLKNLEITNKKPSFKGKKVIVVGGGNTAMDCCRTAIRLGSMDVKVVYRRTEKEMPANPIEIHESKLEGVEYLFLNNPIEVNQDEKGELKSVTLIKMELGEPDASGRRRPVPVKGSEYDIDADYVLAAIGQKTDVHFIDDVNSVAKEGLLEVNKWGDIQADSGTLQTGIPYVFAAGDGVTGAATIIEAIAQAKIASSSCHQYLSGNKPKSIHKEFVSQRSSFKNFHNDHFKESFELQKRMEMPVMNEGDRLNFKEVELGYSEEMCRTEAARCLECGCGEFFDCDLQKYADEYGSEQEKYAGDFNEYQVDFSHPFIEIDNNKCILCSRCIRVCDELVGANALGLVNRGFATYVAPSLGASLTETQCESCGMCIDTCPTGAMRENLIFKPGPVDVEPLTTIDNYGSEGVSINLLSHKQKFVMGVKGAVGLINEQGSIGRRPKFGYHMYNDSSRITKPLLNNDGVFVEISFDEAYKIIADKVKLVDAEENIFFAGARLSNEEIYLVQKLARKAVKTPYILNFHYMGRGSDYSINTMANVPFEHVYEASRIYLLGAELIDDHDYVGFMVNNAKVKNNIPVDMISTNEKTPMRHKVDTVRIVDNYYYFVKAVNYYLLSKGFQNEMYINGNVDGFDDYKTAALKEDFTYLAANAGMSEIAIATWAKKYNNEMNAILIFSEKYITLETSRELYNLAMITGKIGKTASGLMPLKEKNNSQGLLDMGAFPCTAVGGGKTGFKPTKKVPLKLKDGEFANAFIFGEDPIGTAVNRAEVESWLSGVDFLVVQEYFETETTKRADLILPASFPIEMDGSFTNTQKVLQQFTAQIPAAIEHVGYRQLVELGKLFGLNDFDSVQDVFMEIVGQLPQEEKTKYKFHIGVEDSPERKFNYGADSIMKRFDEEFDAAF